MEFNYYIYVDGSPKKVTREEYEKFEGRKRFGPPTLNWVMSRITGLL